MEKAIGLRIRECRKELGISQERLAIESGVSRPTISRIETGKCSNVCVSTLVCIAAALGKNVSIFLA